MRKLQIVTYENLISSRRLPEALLFFFTRWINTASEEAPRVDLMTSWHLQLYINIFHDFMPFLNEKKIKLEGKDDFFKIIFSLPN